MLVQEEAMRRTGRLTLYTLLFLLFQCLHETLALLLAKCFFLYFKSKRNVGPFISSLGNFLLLRLVSPEILGIRVRSLY